MSIESKQMFVNEVKMELGSLLVGSNVDAVMKVLSERLSDFDMEYISEDGDANMGEELLHAFLDAKKVEGRSPQTLGRYEYIIRRVMKSINVPIKKASVYHFRKFFASEKERGISDSTLEGTRQTLHAYFEWLSREGLLEKNPIANMGNIKCAKVERLPYTDVDIERLKESCTQVRDKAIISFLLSTGCRISEMCALNRGDIDFKNMECVVLGKGNKERTVYIDAVTAMLVQRYLETRTDDLEALFIGKRKNRLTPHGVRGLLETTAEKTNVSGKVHPHRFRRTLATKLISHGMPIQEVAVILGHDKLDTTMKYVHLDKSMVKNSYKKYA